MMFLAYFLIGFGLALLLCVVVFLIRDWFYNRKFKSYVEKIKAEGHQAVKDASREISELIFRNKEGKLCTVKIVIDHDIGNTLSEHINDTKFSGNLHDLMSGHKIAESAIGQTEEFIFSSKAVQDMRALGMEPDDVVRQMLRAAGRIT